MARLGPALLAGVLLAGCSGGMPAPRDLSVEVQSSRDPAYDGERAPASAVLSLVPEEAVALTVTDFDEVKADLGLAGIGTADPAEERATFWQRAEAETSMLNGGLLRNAEERLTQEFSFSQLDVTWEAHWYDQTGAELGWALEIGPKVPMLFVQNAVKAGVGPLRGATVVPEDQLVVSGDVAQGQGSWAEIPGIDDLVGPADTATYVERACLTSRVEGELEPLEMWSVGFESGLATARLGPARRDLFERMRLGEQARSFRKGFEGGVADPRTGRIGYRMVDPARAAELALRQKLPFAACE